MSNKLIASYSNNRHTARINLPASKSIANRMLIINAISGNKLQLSNLSESDDTRVMIEGLKNIGYEINIGHAGTAMRFLTAYLTTTGQETIITGSERMKNRPIAKLVDALRSIGAKITYLEKEGYPPLKIGKTITGISKLEIDGDISSQYITALLLISPCLEQGLELQINKKLVSKSYIEMTLALMQQAGVSHVWNGNTIKIAPQQYKSGEFHIESDWSAASYWFEIASFTSKEIELLGLHKESLQGDCDLVNIYKQLGVDTYFGDKNAKLVPNKNQVSFFEYNFINSPDIIQTVAVTCCFKGISFKISGAETLRIKETDRILALQNELGKFGFTIKETSEGVIEWEGTRSKKAYDVIEIDTYDDHRMAMAFAPIAVFEEVIINDPMVVTKSYPNYWDDIKKSGIKHKVTQG